ncbi:hypothetical protein [Streptomyces mirabilis]
MLLPETMSTPLHLALPSEERCPSAAPDRCHAVAAAILGTGEAVQRSEDRKTHQALLREPPHTKKD